ncbi:hypothetical protein [Schwartzia sp. (in: firmicutes)]
MADRIEKITPSKKVTFDVEQFGQRRGNVGDRDGNFQRELKKNIDKDKDKKDESADNVSEAYVVNVSRATQSLFYKDDTVVKEILKDLNEP